MGLEVEEKNTNLFKFFIENEGWKGFSGHRAKYGKVPNKTSLIIQAVII